MSVMAPMRPTNQPTAMPYTYPVRGPARYNCAELPAVLYVVSEARRQVRAAIHYWHLPVDIEIAALLVSELVTNAVLHDTAWSDGDGDGDGEGAESTITLTIVSAGGELRVDVYDSSPDLPALSGDGIPPAEAEHGRGLVLVDSLSTDWGSYRAGKGKAVYFTLAFNPQCGS
jgi:anti-sigma regulatory factor (Ser/Thr protein kinase)